MRWLVMLMLFGGPAAARALSQFDPADLNRSLLKFNEDDAPVRGERENRDEALAYDYVVRFAAGVSPEAFRRAARALTFADLLGPEAATHRGEVVRVEGRLKRIRDIGPTAGLRADGVERIYEGWIFSELYREYSYCALFTELPAGLAVAESLDVPVAFDGFFFKVYRFRAGDGMRKAPLLIGRTLAVLPAPAARSATEALGGSALVTMAMIAGAMAMAGLLVWRLRRGDEATRQRLERARAVWPAEGMGHGPDE